MKKIKEYKTKITSLKEEIASLLKILNVKSEIDVDVFLNFSILDFYDFNVTNAIGMRLLGTENFINLYSKKKVKIKNENNEEVTIEEEIPTKTNIRIPIWYVGKAKITKDFYNREKIIPEIDNAVKLQALYYEYKNLRNEIEAYYTKEFSYFIACEHLETMGDSYFEILKKQNENYNLFLQFQEFKNDLEKKDRKFKETRNEILSKKALQKSNK